MFAAYGFQKLCLGLLAVCVAVIISPASSQAQGVLAFSGQLKSAYPQSTVVEIAAATSRACSSISSKSRRCFFTFAKDCKARGESQEHCTQMSGFCHACTDAYATCKGDANAARVKSKSASTNCATCNDAYSRCIDRMTAQYGTGKKRGTIN